MVTSMGHGCQGNVGNEEQKNRYTVIPDTNNVRPNNEIYIFNMASFDVTSSVMVMFQVAFTFISIVITVGNR